MAIVQLSPVKIGQCGVRPANYKLVSTDSISVVTTAGYIKQGTCGQFFNKNDLFECIVSFDSSDAANAQLYVTIDSNGVIKLNEFE